MILQFLPQAYSSPASDTVVPLCAHRSGLLTMCRFVSQRSPSLSLFLIYPWCVQFSPSWLWPPTSPSCWNPFLFQGQWWCKHNPRGAPISLFSLPMAFGQWLPALAPFLCSKVWCPKVLAHFHSCFLHLVTPLAHTSSTTVPPNQ